MAETAAKTNEDVTKLLKSIQREVGQSVVISLLVSRTGKISFLSAMTRRKFLDDGLDLEDDDENGQPPEEPKDNNIALKKNFPAYLG